MTPWRRPSEILAITVALGISVTSVTGVGVRRSPGRVAQLTDRADEAPQLAAGIGEPVVVTADHALESVWWRPDGHLLVLTPEELLDVDPDAPLPARRVALHHGKRIRGSAAGTFVVERADGWESRDAVSLARLAGGASAFDLALSDDGSFLATPLCDEHDDAGRPRCRFAVIDVRTGLVRARMPPGPDAERTGAPGSFTFLRGGAPGSSWAALLSGRELTVVDFTDGTVHLRRKLRRVTEDGRSRELLEIRGRHAYLTSAYGFEVVDLPRDLTLVRERDPQADTEVTFAVSEDGATVTEASTFAETLVTSWDVPVGASVAQSASAAAASSGDESPDHRYVANLRAGTLSVTSLRSGAEVLHLGPPGAAPVDMFRRLTLVGDVPVVRDRRGGALVLSQQTPAGPEGLADAGGALSAPDGMLLATADPRFAYFVGAEHDDQVPALLPFLRVDRRTGESVPVFAAQRSAVAQFPADHAVEIFGDEDEARASIVCATETSWLAAGRCLNVFLVPGRFDGSGGGEAPRARSGDHAPESVR